MTKSISIFFQYEIFDNRVHLSECTLNNDVAEFKHPLSTIDGVDMFIEVFQWMYDNNDTDGIDVLMVHSESDVLGTCTKAIMFDRVTHLLKVGGTAHGIKRRRISEKKSASATPDVSGAPPAAMGKGKTHPRVSRPRATPTRRPQPDILSDWLSELMDQNVDTSEVLYVDDVRARNNDTTVQSENVCQILVLRKRQSHYRARCAFVEDYFRC